MSANKDIIEIGKLLWEKNLASGLNGNISARIDEKSCLLTARGTCLGRLEEIDIVKIDLNGNILGQGEASTEKLMHTAVYQNFPSVQAIVHTHLTFASGYFNINETLTPGTFESRLYLGEIKAIEQNTPTVTDIDPVIEALKNNNIIVLKKHGVLAVGKSLFDCFLLIQCLEESVKMDAVSKIYQNSAQQRTLSDRNVHDKEDVAKEKKFKLFSMDQMQEIVRVVNADDKLAELGQKTDMTMDLAVVLEETNKKFCFQFQKGKITAMTRDDKAEFVVLASAKIWRSVFEREIDPFVATTQKKMILKGDFAKISKWYAPCSRLFELWQQVPLEQADE